MIKAQFYRKEVNLFTLHDILTKIMNVTKSNYKLSQMFIWRTVECMYVIKAATEREMLSI